MYCIDEFVKAMQCGIPNAHADKVQELWKSFDTQNKGFIAAADFRYLPILSAMGIASSHATSREVMTKLGDRPLTHEEVDDMMRSACVQGDDEINFAHFKTMLLGG